MLLTVSHFLALWARSVCFCSLNVFLQACEISEVPESEPNREAVWSLIGLCLEPAHHGRTLTLIALWPASCFTPALLSDPM